MDKTGSILQKEPIYDESSKRQNFYALKKNFSQQKLSEILTKNENEETDHSTSDDKQKFDFLRKEKFQATLAHYQETHERQSRLLLNNSSNKLNMCKSMSNKKLLRNNSFRAAIGEIQLQNADSTSTLSAQKSQTTTPTKKKCPLTRSATNEFRHNHMTNTDNFDFKMPKPIMRSPFSKSVSMNFSTLDASASSSHEAKKRKASLSSSSSSSSTTVSVSARPKSKINKNADQAWVIIFSNPNSTYI